MIPELYFLGAMATVTAYGIYDHIRYKEYKGDSCFDDVIEQFDRFLKRCKDKETAHVVFFLPTLEEACEFAFLYNVKIDGNEEVIREALKTKDFTKIIHREKIDFNYMKQGKYKFESIPLSNWFQINYFND